VKRLRTTAPSPLAAAAALALLCGCASVSPQQEVEIGQQEVQKINAQLPLLNDAQITGYVTQLGTSIARTTSRADLDWHFYVVNTDVINAFAVPGGFIYVNRGVLDRASNMSELAGVLGHEIEHIVRRHSVKQMEQVQGANVGVALACALTGVCENQAAQAAVQVGGAAVFAKFSRQDEIEADDGGFNNLVRSGIDPTGMLTFFQKLLAEQQRGDPKGVSAWFADHPGTQDRIADIQRMLSQLPEDKRSQLRRDDPAFQSMKQHLAQLPPAPPPPQSQ